MAVTESRTDSNGRARELLQPIEHIVVIMLENRSFDHMLGYLALQEHQLPDHGELPTDVNGLDSSFSNSFAGQLYKPEPMDENEFLSHRVDPPHDFEHVATQIAGGSMSGFVEALANSLQEKGRFAEANDPKILKTVMGYMTPDQVPVYDHLVRNFCLCDRFFCSVPGPTLPNRFFSVTGTSSGVTSNIDLIVGHFGKFKSLFRHVAPDSWRWYSSDPGILRAVDEQFMFDQAGSDHFAYFDQLTESQPRSFLRDVLGDSQTDPSLPAVAWIDPNFNMKDITGIPGLDGPGSNDDHPPSPVILGQKLAHKLYRAIGESRYWSSSLIVITYDEHGGFADHEPPPDGFGPRIPVLLVSPHVKRGVCHKLFDHASLIKTILLRFSDDTALSEMPPAVQVASDFSEVMRTDGSTVPYCEIVAPGAAALTPGDLEPAFLPNDGSTIARTISFADSELTDLQKDIVRGLAIPLRTGYLFMRRARKWPWLTKLAHLLARVPKRERLLPRRP